MAGESSVDAASSPPPSEAPRRKFAVQPVETTSRSSKAERDKKKKEQENQENASSSPPSADQAEKPARRRFLPQPVEETSRSTRRGGSRVNGAATENNDGESGEHSTKSNPSSDKKPRKFAVEPVETVKRVRRRNTGPALQPGDRTDESSVDQLTHKNRHSRHLILPSEPAPPANSPNAHDNNPYDEGVPQPPESRFSYANLARKASRQSSMRKPTLEPISSAPESEESNFSKRSSHSSSSSAHEDARQQMLLQLPKAKRQPRQKESYEEVFSGYLLDIAAKAAQQQLREQVAEAYPNERLYEPVDHFAVDRESDSDVEDGLGQLPDIDHQEFGNRRESNAGWTASDLKKHKETLEQQKRDEEQQKQAKQQAKQQVKQQVKQQQDQKQKLELPKKMHLTLPKPDPTRISPSSGTPKKDPFGNAFNLAGIGAEGVDQEMKRMQDKARPPMLGLSLVFPKCQSPRPTLIDPLQRHGTRRNTGLISRQNSGLWSPGCPMSPGTPKSPVSLVSMSKQTSQQSPKSSVCLWGGSCTADQAAKMRGMFPSNVQTGIMTPQYAPDEDPFERYARDESLKQAQTIHQQIQEMQNAHKQSQILPQQAARANNHNTHQLPTNPGSRPQSILGIDQLLVMEQRIEQEYPDAFVTQIYNYLSLGYPAIAREYDEELSKISKVSVEEIRRDDLRKNTKGYVGAPEGNGVAESTVREECGRWRALRLYIREWARQQPNMMEDGAEAIWGVRARKGSWFA